MKAPFQAYWPPLAIFALDFVLLLAAAWFSVWWLAGIFSIACIIMLFDARARTKDFDFALSHIAAGRRPDRVAGLLRPSWCCRMACQAAADARSAEAGETVRGYYAGMGYRWFHVFPDATFTRDTPFLHLQFWRVTLLGYAQARGRSGARSVDIEDAPEIRAECERIGTAA